MGRAGFRIDSQSLPQTNLTLIGEVYSNTLDIYSGSPNALDGGHITGRMVHEFDNQSSLTIQSYFEHSNRIYFFYSDEQRETYDISASYNFNLYERHKVVVGAGLRSSSDETGAFPFLEFLPPSETFRTFNVYFSDEIAISPDRFYLTVGAMLVDNTYINWELQPTIRVRFHPNSASTVWAAVSRATRIPARVDTGLVLGSGNNRIYGSRNYESEELLSYELGYRFQPLPNLFFDVSAFHSTYDELRTLEPHPDLPGNFIFGNMLEGTIHGGEALIFYTPAYWLKFELSGSWVSKSFNYKAGSNATGTPNEGVDPTFISTFRTAIELPYQLEADFSLRYTDDVPGVIRDHLALDVRLSWAPSKDIEIAIVGRNLLEHYHTEVDMSVARSIYGKIVARF